MTSTTRPDATPAAQSPARTLRYLFKAMRPRQWTKNLFVYAALLFDAKLLDVPLFLKTTAGFLIFCLLSSAVYLINDLSDMEADRAHPTKRFRPLASGRLSPRVAIVATVLFIAVSLPASFALDWRFGLISIGYLALQIAYTFVLKNIVLVDVFCIAAGFVLRVAAGVVLVQARNFSPWLYLTVTLLALFIAIGKRRHELTLLQGKADSHRRILSQYNLRLLDDMMGLVTAATAVTYAFYTFSAPNLPPNHLMMLTIPFVLYGIFRYQYLIHVRGEGGSPDELLLRDKPLIVDIVLWGLTVFAVMYIVPA
ncbi:MAG: decaprenyl-phosphate phosphoribosyltransferase [Anaerolineae bacterium]